MDAINAKYRNSAIDPIQLAAMYKMGVFLSEKSPSRLLRLVAQACQIAFWPFLLHYPSLTADFLACVCTASFAQLTEKCPAVITA